MCSSSHATLQFTTHSVATAATSQRSQGRSPADVATELLPSVEKLTVPMRTASEVSNVIELFRQNYERR